MDQDLGLGESTGRPIDGRADRAHASPVTIGSVNWSPGDGGKTRTRAPTDIGAYER